MRDRTMNTVDQLDASEYEIEIQNLTKVFETKDGDYTALKDLNLVINPLAISQTGNIISNTAPGPNSHIGAGWAGFTKLIAAYIISVP